jgi:aldehyde dehydrogenase (NAD+)
MIGLVCGDPILWKPSERTPLTTLAVHRIALEAMRGMPDAPEGLLAVLVGIGESIG